VPAARFYHLTDTAPEALLPLLIGKAFESGMRVALRGADRDRMAALDLALWAGDGFLPHGLAGGPHDADQPALLVWDSRPAPELPNRPGCLIVLDGCDVTEAEAMALERVLILFDGADPSALATVRGQWRALTGAGVPAEYWNRDSGRWACQRRHPA
jgi:DNA polymerase III subunit chi